MKNRKFLKEYIDIVENDEEDLAAKAREDAIRDMGNSGYIEVTEEGLKNLLGLIYQETDEELTKEEFLVSVILDKINSGKRVLSSDLQRLAEETLKEKLKAEAKGKNPKVFLNNLLKEINKGRKPRERKPVTEKDLLNMIVVSWKKAFGLISSPKDVSREDAGALLGVDLKTLNNDSFEDFLRSIVGGINAQSFERMEKEKVLPKVGMRLKAKGWSKEDILDVLSGNEKEHYLRMT